MLIVAASTGLMLFQIIESEKDFHSYLSRSVPFVGTNIPRLEEIEGNGIKVAVIDTGVDFNHPDLYGWSSDGKVIGGYNFIQEKEIPLDTNGHGTQVAGVIAANGHLLGIAPKAKILAYKVSENGEDVSSDLIIKAIERSIEDNADIINISLGVNKTNASIEHAVDKALKRGIFVVTAAGNDGPALQTIGSPGRNHDAITVGATYNNLTSSLVATLEVNEKPYTVIPMVGSSKLNEPIIGKIVFGGYGKEKELKDIDGKDSILLVERGSDVKEDRLYFSTKEKNAAEIGVKALIVYNNEPGVFLGELIHEFVEPTYKPQIPVVSIDRKEGLEIREVIQEKNKVVLHLFYNPDFVAHFSSRGPVSPFYIKPDILAPGVYINTTQIHGGYNVTSGTSFAAPHVSGAIALLLEKYPNMAHSEIRSLLLTTAEPVSNAYGQKFSLNDSGAGRLDIAKAFQAKLIIVPPNFVVNVSPDNPIIEKQIEIKLIEGSLKNLRVEFDGSDLIQFTYALEGNNLQIKMKMTGQDYGDYEGNIIINHDDTTYRIPFLVHYTEGSISANYHDEELSFKIHNPEQWDFAKISVTNSKNGNTETITATPERDASIKIYENTEYWIDAKIKVNSRTFDAYNTIEVRSVDEDTQNKVVLNIPEKQLAIISGIILIIGIIGMVAIKKTKS
jgi:minor extracellular serine protease Vpr